jgi:hypothetical protein
MPDALPQAAAGTSRGRGRRRRRREELLLAFVQSLQADERAYCSTLLPPQGRVALRIALLNGQSVSVAIDLKQTVLALKQQIAQATDQAPQFQKLFLAGSEDALADDAVLVQCGARAHCTLFLLPADSFKLKLSTVFCGHFASLDADLLGGNSSTSVSTSVRCEFPFPRTGVYKVKVSFEHAMNGHYIGLAGDALAPEAWGEGDLSSLSAKPGAQVFWFDPCDGTWSLRSAYYDAAGERHADQTRVRASSLWGTQGFVILTVDMDRGAVSMMLRDGVQRKGWSLPWGEGGQGQDQGQAQEQAQEQELYLALSLYNHSRVRLTDVSLMDDAEALAVDTWASAPPAGTELTRGSHAGAPPSPQAH